MPPIRAGAAVVDISPQRSTHLFGYPHVPRMSTGIHDPLLSSVLYLSDGETELLIVANDIIFVPKDLGQRARNRIASATGVPENHIVLTATHTHSGPSTVAYVSNEADPTVPPLDTGYLTLFEDGMVEAACAAHANAKEVELGLAIADGSCVGGNRRDPSGPRDAEVPVLVARSLEGENIAAMLVCAMHPTVLHEDSKLVSADFPGACRDYLQKNTLSEFCVVLHHTGAAGNQSPRHAVEANTFAESDRLGQALGESVAKAVETIEYHSDITLAAATAEVTLPVRDVPSEDESTAALERARDRFESLKAANAPRAEVRTAECDVFGAEESVTLARAAASGRLEQAANACMPAEIQAIRIGPWKFVAWPGEHFVEFALAVKESSPDTYVITLANGELQGYLVTEEAVRENAYEATNALFKSPESGERIVEATKRLMSELDTQ